MNKKVFILSVVRSFMSNWNADFSNRPQVAFDNTIFANATAYKYALRNLWDSLDERVFVYKSSYIDENGNEVIQMLKGKYEELFGKGSLSIHTSEQVYKNLLSCIDIENFGVTFAAEGNNISIPGAVQVTNGINLYKDTAIIDSNIMSAFATAAKKKEKKKESEEIDDEEAKKQTTLGRRSITDDAFYGHTVTVNGYAYNRYTKLLKDYNGYSEEAYEKLKNACLHGATEMHSLSKEGCENVFGLFAESKEGERPSITNLHNYVNVYKDNRDEIVAYMDITNLISILSKMSEKLNDIQLYMNNEIITLVYRDEKNDIVKIHDTDTLTNLFKTPVKVFEINSEVVMDKF